jgi:ATP-dependent helicase/nuclease subunit A
MDATRPPAALLTPAQQLAVTARGNVLVMAGAGTGKTKTLVERCLHCLEHDGAALEELLIVTFTEAAAAEMRERLRQAIEARAQAEADAALPEGPPTSFWAEQLARFDLAHLGTLHSFCLRLVREHFYELGLDPRLALLAEGEARQLAHETLEEQLAAHYDGDDEFSRAVQDLIQVQGGGRDDALRQLILQLHHYSQARPDAAGWLARQRESFAAAEPVDWLGWLLAEISRWRDEWLPVLTGLQGANEKAAELAAALARLGPLSAAPAWRQTAAEVLAQILAADETWPARRKTVLRQPLADVFAEAQFLHSLAVVPPAGDPLVEDWTWVRGQMATLLRLAEDFAARLASRKLAIGVLDFHDLEQFALRLLWDFATGQPTPVAMSWRAQFKFVFVDEYQDINAAQDKIIQGLSRSGAAANRFLVGDVKQSIYRFRLADPSIFRDYARGWRGAAGQVIALADNFRSREGLLLLVNSLFRCVMREAAGGVAYDAAAELQFGSPAARADLSAASARAPRAELLLRGKRGRAESRADDGGPLAGLDEAQREARLIAHRLKALMAARHEIFDLEKKVFRPLAWRDIAILLRSPRGRSEAFAKEFEGAGIPLAVERGGFYRSAEILDLVSLLQLLDNPLQDVPCLAVLRSPLVGLTVEELAEIRLAAKDRRFWTALNRRAEAGFARPATAAKVARFLERFARWRRLARLGSLSQCLEQMLAETLYADWLQTQPRGRQRAANVAGFQQLAQQFDQFQRQGLFRFLRFLEAQQEADTEPEVSSLAAEDAVRLLSIHQSKGLEFPVVVLADLAKQFNEQDLRGDLIFDPEYGLCPKIKPPHLGRRYPSLPHWLAQRRHKADLRGEELRLLYVALTRAQDYLILVASISEKSWEEQWTQPQPATAQKVISARSYADWLALWFASQLTSPLLGSAGTLPYLRWQWTTDAEAADEPAAAPVENQPAVPAGPMPEPPVADDATISALRARLEWVYPFPAATRRRAKASVTTLRREAEELDEEAEPIFPPQPRPRPRPRRRPARDSQLSAAEIGAAHHKFLQHLELAQAGNLAAEADRLAQAGYLSSAEAAALDLSALAAFWHSPVGRKLLAYPAGVRRELPFTARFSPAELAVMTGAPAEAGLESEYVIVQGVADLVVLRPDETWLIDFKTDAVTARDLPQKIKIYSPQLRLYAAALEKIFARPVTLRALHFLVPGRTEEI